MTTVEINAGVHVTTVSDRRVLAEGVVEMTLDAPLLARMTRPGQYVMAIPPSAQAAAIALAVYETQSKHATLLFFVTGNRTRELAALRPGDRLDVVGPLGNGFDCSGKARDVAIVAGGVGIASVLLAARAFVAAGARVRLFYGARTAELLVDGHRFAAAGCELVLATDDGSAGERGFITERLLREPKPESILACGPTPMLRAVARDCRRAARSRAALAGRNLRLRGRRLLGLRGAARSRKRASTKFPAAAARGERRGIRARL